MQRLFAYAVLVLAVVAGASFAAADMPPPYEPHGIGARLAEAQPFPVLADLKAGTPAAKAGLKNGDAVIAIDGDYSAAGRVPFYFFARGMQGPKNSFVELVIVRDQRRVFTVKVQRSVSIRGGW